MRSNRIRGLMLVGLLLVSLAGVACGGAADEPAVVDLALEATDIAYSANRLEVAANQPVRLTLQNNGTLEHDFSIHQINVTEVHAPESAGGEHDMSHVTTDLALHVAAPIGGSSVLEFTPITAGEYEYYCTIPGHREAGMVGTLVVAP